MPCPPDLAGAFLERFGLEEVVTSYGSTEVGMVARRTLDAPPGSVGRVDPDLYATRVVDADEEDVPAGEVGELLVRPLLPWTMTQGYFGMPERTLEAFRNLWFHTGDAARLDADGNLWFVDRIKDRIRRRGENIASVDVETVLMEHPRVADAAVIAVPSEEQGGEDEIKAVVVAAPGAALDAATVWAWCDEIPPLLRRPALRRDPAGAAEDPDGEDPEDRAEGGRDHARDERPRRLARRRPPLGPASTAAVAAQTAMPPTGITATTPRRARRRSPRPCAPPGMDLDEGGLVLGRVHRAEQQLCQLRLERPSRSTPRCSSA